MIDESKMGQEKNLEGYVGRTIEVPMGKQRLDKIRKSEENPENCIVTLSGLDDKGTAAYSDEAELPLRIIEELYGKL